MKPSLSFRTWKSVKTKPIFTLVSGQLLLTVSAVPFDALWRVTEQYGLLLVIGNMPTLYPETYQCTPKQSKLQKYRWGEGALYTVKTTSS